MTNASSGSVVITMMATLMLGIMSVVALQNNQLTLAAVGFGAIAGLVGGHLNGRQSPN